MKVFNYISENIKLAFCTFIIIASGLFSTHKDFLFTFPEGCILRSFLAVDNIDTANGSIEAWREIFRRFENNQANNFIDIGHWTLNKAKSSEPFVKCKIVFHAVLDTKYGFLEKPSSYND